MEVRSDNLEVQVNVLKEQTPNQQLLVANEDFALTSEVAIERSDFVEVEKRTVIKKKCIINEKYVIPKPTWTGLPVYQGHQTLSIDASASLIGCDFNFPDSQESGAMEIASQGSLESKMDISSQESLMEYSSPETDIPNKPVNETVNSNEANCDDKFIKENGSLVHPDVPQTEENCYAEVTSTSDKPLVLQDDLAEHEISDSYKDNGISRRNVQEYEDEKDSENEVDYTKQDQSIDRAKAFNRRSSTERLLLAREEYVTAREEACNSREKALKKREAVFANREEILKECVDKDIPLPKRLKLKKVFECP